MSQTGPKKGVSYSKIVKNTPGLIEPLWIEQSIACNVYT